jgi:hypothetical protein
MSQIIIILLKVQMYHLSKGTANLILVNVVNK